MKRTIKKIACIAGGSIIVYAGWVGSIYIMATDKIQSDNVKGALAGFCYGATAVAGVRLCDLGYDM